MIPRSQPALSATKISFFLLILGSILLRAGEAPRQWIDREGRTVVATLVTADAERCTLQLPNGETSTIPLADLNEEGKEYIREWAAASERTGDRLRPIPGPWPKRVSAGNNGAVTAVEQDAAPGVHVYRSRHFELRSDVPLLSGTTKEFAEIFEATLAALQAIPLGLDPRPPPSRYPVDLFLDPESFKRAGAPGNVAGFYNPMARRLVISLGNLGFSAEEQRLRLDYRRSLFVLKHEATHQVLGKWSLRFPVWLAEGWAEYVAALPYERGAYHFNNTTESTKAYLNKWRREADPRRIPVLHPENLMRMGYPQWAGEVAGDKAILNYNSAGLLVHYFVHFDGDGRGSQMAAYLHALRGARNHIELRHVVREAENEFLLRGRSHDQLAADLVDAWKKHGVFLQVRAE